MGLFPFVAELATGKKLTLRRDPETGIVSFELQGLNPAPLDDPDAMEKLSLVLEYAANKRRDIRDRTLDSQANEEEHRD